MDKKYRFKFKQNGVIVEMDEWDVLGMVKNAHDWECMDDVSRVLLGPAADVIPPPTPPEPPPEEGGETRRGRKG